MGRKAVSELTKWMISNREIARKLKISENCVRNTLKTLKTTGDIQRHVGLGRLKKLRSAKTALYLVN